MTDHLDSVSKQVIESLLDSAAESVDSSKAPHVSHLALETLSSQDFEGFESDSERPTSDEEVIYFFSRRRNFHAFSRVSQILFV